MLLLPNQSTLFWSGVCVQGPNEKRTEKLGVFGNNLNTDASHWSFVSLNIDKERKQMTINNFV